MVMLALLLAGPVTPVMAQESGFPLPALEVITVENVHQIKKLVTFRLAGEDFELVSSVAFSPDGTMLASGSSERVLLWDLTSGEQIHEFLDTTNWEPQLAFSPDSRFLAITNWGSIDLWDLATSELKTSFVTEHNAASVAYSPDGTLVASGGARRFNRILLWSVDPIDQIETNEPLADLGSHFWTVNTLAFSPDGTKLASGDSNDITVWPIVLDGEVVKGCLAYGEIIYELRWTSTVNSLSWSPDGKTLACGNSDGSVWRWNADSPWQTLTPLGSHSHAVSSVAFHPNGILLASGSGYYSEDGALYLWNVDTKEVLVALETYESDVSSVAFNLDGTLLAVAVRYCTAPPFLDTETQLVIERPPT